MAEEETPKTATTRFGMSSPILAVRDVAASLDYYVTVLGFAVDWHDPGIFASVSRDRCNITLCEGDQGHPGAWVWIGVGSVERLFEEYRTRGARVRHPPTNYPWACEMQIEDLDGNVLRLGSESKTDQPFGEWLDMRGDAWVRGADGRPQKVPRE